MRGGISFLTFDEFGKIPKEILNKLQEGDLLLEGARGPGKTQMVTDAFENLMEFSQTTIIEGKAAVESFERLKKALEQSPRTFKVKPRAWTPGLTAPMRRGRHK